MQEAEKIWMNGVLVNWADAKVHVLSHGLHYGTTVFEGIRSYDADGGRRSSVSATTWRASSARPRCTTCRSRTRREELRSAIHQVIAANGLGACYIRPIAMRGYGTMGLFPLEAPVDVAVAAWEWGAYLGEDGLRTGIRAKVSSWRRIGSSTIPATAKAGGQYLNSILAKIETHKAGYQEAILLNEAGYVADGSGENLFLVRDGVLITPPVHASILEGITRASIIALAARRGHPGARARDRPRRALPRRRGVHHRHRGRGLPGHRGRRSRRSAPPARSRGRLQERFFAATEGRDPRSAEWLDYVAATAPAPAASTSAT